jgi:hypothetical protein
MHWRFVHFPVTLLAHRGRFPALRTVLCVAAATVLLSSGYALAAEAAPEPQNPDEVICKSVATNTGTRLGRTKECHTWREWEQRRREDREMTERSQMRDSRNPPVPGGGN